MDESLQGEPTAAAARAEIARLHEFKHWPASRLWPMIIATFALQGAAVYVWPTYWPLLLLIWPALGALLFVFALTFHDASHHRLHPVRWLNEVFGHIVGVLTFIPLDVYRYAHARHHAYLGTPDDPELWPFNTPSISRAARIASALLEIVFSLVYTPLLFLRCVVVGKPTRWERRRIILGYVISAATWAAILVTVHSMQVWGLFLVAALVPLWLSAMMQTLNKFTQHLGLHGETVLGLTRTVVDEHQATELVSSAMFFNDYHGTHHRYAKIPYYNLPEATPLTLANAHEPGPVFPNLAAAVIDMLPSLADPKVGAQWENAPQPDRCAATGSAAFHLLRRVPRRRTDG